ncbi:MAG TPA: hypothetical protein VE691_17630 [Rubrobacter sp.]|jgi:hypothetical protein|nr:hypothetical protein [Rubrobacter sp.]
MSPDDHIEYAPFEAQGFYESFLHERHPAFRIYPGMLGEAD